MTGVEDRDIGHAGATTTPTASGFLLLAAHPLLAKAKPEPIAATAAKLLDATFFDRSAVKVAYDLIGAI